jgi:protein-S-isoprenylcysteine O-methyltransferase Ste14
MEVPRSMQEKDVPGVIAPPPLILAATLALGLLFDWLLPAYVLQVLLLVDVRIAVGVVFAGAGAGMIVAALLNFHRAGTPPEPWKPTLNLASDGIYAYTRNPIYVGLLILTAGIGLALASDWTLVMLIPAALVLHYGVVLREERYLERKFGDAYRQYRSHVPRYGWRL